MGIVGSGNHSIVSFKEYERLMVEATEMITLARAIRGSYLADKSSNHVVIQTQYGLKEGMLEAVIEERKAIAAKKRESALGTQKDSN